MFPEKFQELEDKIRLTAEVMAQLKHEKTQLEQKNQEAEQRIAGWRAALMQRPWGH